jgi:putative Mg2+ transporter-C (MgtC) family protein
MALADLAPVPASAVEIAARPLVAMVAGALIGVERQWHHRAAGVRTHALLALGAAGFALIAHLLAVRDPQMNPAQIAAGVVSGIGFLCGGVILHRGGAVQGLTSAASLWTTAGVGLAIGAGYYPLASVLVVAILTVQFPLRWAEDHLGRPALPPSPSLWLVRMQGSRQAVERLWRRCLEGRSDAAAVNRVAIRRRREEADVVLVAELSLSDAEALAVVALGEDSGDGIAAVRCTRVAQPREA